MPAAVGSRMLRRGTGSQRGPALGFVLRRGLHCRAGGADCLWIRRLSPDRALRVAGWHVTENGAATGLVLGFVYFLSIPAFFHFSGNLVLDQSSAGNALASRNSDSAGPFTLMLYRIAGTRTIEQTVGETIKRPKPENPGFRTGGIGFWFQECGMNTVL
jgi:hypothetical protein